MRGGYEVCNNEFKVIGAKAFNAPNIQQQDIRITYHSNPTIICLIKTL